MSNRIYPRTVWVLHPSFKPVAVEVVQKYGSPYQDYGDMTAKGKRYGVAQMFATKEEAIAAGRYDIARSQFDLDKRAESLRKKIAALDKAEGK